MIFFLYIYTSDYVKSAESPLSPLYYVDYKLVGTAVSDRDCDRLKRLYVDQITRRSRRSRE